MSRSPAWTYWPSLNLIWGMLPSTRLVSATVLNAVTVPRPRRMIGTSCALASLAMTGTGLGPVFALAVGFDVVAFTNTKAPAPRARAAIETERYLRLMAAHLRDQSNVHHRLAICDMRHGFMRLMFD